MNNIHLSFEQRNYVYNQVVYFENTKPEYVYFVQQGEFELVKTPKKHRPTDLTLNAHDLLGPDRQVAFYDHEAPINVIKSSALRIGGAVDFAIKSNPSP